MRWPIGVLTICAMVNLLGPGVVAHFDCEDEAEWSDPSGSVHTWTDGDETWVYMESNTYPGLQRSGCFDSDETFYSQDDLIAKL